MKIAVSGKGGVGKSTLAAILSHQLADSGRRVLAVDADPDSNLARRLGVPQEVYRSIVPISQQRRLIEQRTGAKVRKLGQLFKLNPEVSDIADSYGHDLGAVTLLVMGGAQYGGKGCACPENVLLRSLLAQLLLHREEAVVVDMEAGIEHLGRGTAAAVNALLTVVEPDTTSLETAERVAALASEIGLSGVHWVANKITGEDDLAFIRERSSGKPLLGYLPMDEGIRRAERDNLSPFEQLSSASRAQLAALVGQLETATA